MMTIEELLKSLQRFPFGATVEGTSKLVINYGNNNPAGFRVWTPDEELPWIVPDFPDDEEENDHGLTGADLIGGES